MCIGFTFDSELPGFRSVCVYRADYLLVIIIATILGVDARSLVIHRNPVPAILHEDIPRIFLTRVKTETRCNVWSYAKI